jgi:hypothetical protein
MPDPPDDPGERTESGVPTFHGKHDATDRRNSTNTWHECKAHGDVGENKVAMLLRRIGCKAKTIALDGQHGGDLLVTWPGGLVERVEVKTDRLVHVTGNLAIELARRSGVGQVRSGVNFSASDLFAFPLDAGVLLVPTAGLRELANRPGWNLVWCGDGGRSRCALVPVLHVQALDGARLLTWRGGSQ